MKCPDLDVHTRWNSTYNMLQKLIPFKQFLKDQCITPCLSDDDWKILEDLVKHLKPIYDTTLKFQSEQLYLGDFFITWITLKLTIESFKNTTILKFLKKREEALLNNPTVLAAIFLDPRIRRIIIKNPDKMHVAKTHLKKLARLINTLNLKVQHILKL